VGLIGSTCTAIPRVPPQRPGCELELKKGDAERADADDDEWKQRPHQHDVEKVEFDDASGGRQDSQVEADQADHPDEGGEWVRNIAAQVEFESKF